MRTGLRKWPLAIRAGTAPGPRAAGLRRRRSSTRLLVALAAALFVLPGGVPVRGQPPGIIEPFDNGADLYYRANRLYNYANERKDHSEKRRAFQGSIPLFREYLRTGPRGDLAQQAGYQLGMALLMTGDLDGAERTFQGIITRYRTGNWVALSAYRQAAQMYNRKEWGQAAPFFGVAARQAKDPELRHKSIYYEARCLTFANKGDAAIDRLRRIVEDPTNPFRDYARLAIGELHASAGRHEQALEQFELLLDPATPSAERSQALLMAGVSAQKLGQTEKAEKLLNQTLDSPRVDPKVKAKAQRTLMEMRFEEENYPEVVKVFRRGEFLGLKDDLARIYMLAGISLARLDRHNEAIRQFFNAERLAPQSELGFEANFRRVSSFYQINGPNIPRQVDAFINVYGEGRESHEWIQKARLMKAEILFGQRATPRAAMAYKAVNASSLPEEMRPGVLFKRGWCLGDNGEYAPATTNLSKFIADFPDHPDITAALAKRGHAYHQLGDRHLALKDFKAVLERDGVEPTLAAFALQHCGRIHREELRFEEMIASYQKLLELGSSLGSQSRADANYWIGWGWYKLEQWDKAIPHLETARTLLPQLYKEPAGVHIVLAAYSNLDSDKLKEAADRLIVDAPHQRLPARLLIWLGLERFQKGDYEGADRFLGFACTPDEPELTDVLVWRHLAKAQLENRHFDRALKTLAILLEQDQEDFWKADAFLDRSHALIGNSDWEEARQAAHQGLELDPQGTVQAGLYMALADVAMHRKDFQSAADSYLRTAEMFIDDKEIKPLALFRAAEAFEKNDQLDEAARIRKKLRDEFPSWTAASTN